MSNPNPNPVTRFKPGNPGGGGRLKKMGDRDRLTAAFLYELAESFEQHGKDVITAVMTMDTPKYLAIIAALVPRQVEISTHPMEGLDDGKLAEAIEALTEMLRAKVPPAEPEPMVLQ